LGNLLIRKASKTFSILASSISNLMFRKTKKKRHGFDLYLIEVEESEFKTWCFTMQARAFFATLKNSVQDIVRPIQGIICSKMIVLGKMVQMLQVKTSIVLRIGEGLELKKYMGLNKTVCM